MEQDALREAKMPSGSSEIHIVVWNLEVHYCCHNSLPFIPFLHHISLIHACFFKINFKMYNYYFCTAVFQVVSSLQVSSPEETSVHFFFPPYVPHALPSHLS